MTRWVRHVCLAGQKAWKLVDIHADLRMLPCIIGEGFLEIRSSMTRMPLTASLSFTLQPSADMKFTVLPPVSYHG